MRPAIALIAAGLSVAGCSPSDRMSLDLMTDDQFYIVPALNATAARFFGPVAPPTSPLSFVDIDGRTLTRGGGVAFRQTRSRMTSLSLTAERPVNDRLGLTGRMSVATGQSRFYLPNGAGILADPITIRFSHETIGVEAGLAYDLARDTAIVPRVTGGIGGQVARVKGAITSALLNVHDTSTQSGTYIYVGLQARVNTPRESAATLALHLRTKYAAGSLPVVQAGISIGF